MILLKYFTTLIIDNIIHTFKILPLQEQKDVIIINPQSCTMKA